VIISVVAAPTVMLKGCVADCAGVLPSVTLAVKDDGPVGPVGVPAIAPVLLIKLSPAGNVPALTLNDSGANPVAWIAWLYAEPSTAAGREIVVIVGGAGGLDPLPPHPLKAMPIPTASTPNNLVLADIATFTSVT